MEVFWRFKSNKSTPTLARCERHSNWLQLNSYSITIFERLVVQPSRSNYLGISNNLRETIWRKSHEYSHGPHRSAIKNLLTTTSFSRQSLLWLYLLHKLKRTLGGRFPEIDAVKTETSSELKTIFKEVLNLCYFLAKRNRP